MSRSVFILLFLLYAASSPCQQAAKPAHIIHELPSDKTYNLLVDRTGYLWIATENGVARYNGYEMKRYTLADGLYNEDIWSLHEDRKGRIWLSSIAGGFAYIRDNQLSNAITPAGKTLYPKSVVNHDTGIAFVSQYFNRAGTSLCMVRNDTILSFDLSAYPGKTVLNDRSDIILCHGDTVTVLHYGLKNGSLSVKRSVSFRCEGIEEVNNAKVTYAFKNYLIFHGQGDSVLHAVDLQKQMSYKIRLPQPIYYSSATKNHLYAFGQKRLFELDTQMGLKRSFRIADLAGDSIVGADCSYFIDDQFWGRWLATGKGLFSMPPSATPFPPSSADLKGYKKVGTAGDTSYWWNNNTGDLGIVCPSGLNSHHLVNLHNITSVTRYSRDSLLLFTIDKIYWFDSRKGIVTSFFKGFRQISRDGETAFDTGIAAGGLNAVVTSRNTFYMVSQTKGFCKYIFDHNRLSVNIISYDRYSGILYDPQDNYVIVYKPEKIEFYRNDVRRKTLDRNLLLRNGISSIEEVLTDRYGNVYIKDYRHLAAFNFVANKFDHLFAQYPQEAQAALNRDRLVVAGKFGILVSKVRGLGDFEAPFTFDNTKLSAYTRVTGMAVMPGTALLNTDRGTYVVPLSPPIASPPIHKYKIVLNYNGRLSSLTEGDTILLHHNKLRLLFDIINPTGVGKAERHISIDGVPYETISGELILHAIRPDQYYTLDISFSDDVWRSPPTHLYVYMIPFWWERQSFRKWIIAGYVLAGMIVISLLVFIAIRVATRRQQQRNALLSLELKAVHAQINPHFIYNSLSATVFFISHRMLDEAIDHVHKFSDLLRSYVKSSRTRVITIKDEVTNLRNYIELQQTRFQHKFDYSMSVSPEIDDGATYIPSLLLQPIVENAINHGLFHRKSQGLLEILFTWRRPGGLVITVKDNGIGREQSRIREAKNPGQSYGSNLVRDLVAIFNRYEKMNININYIDLQPPGTGTVVEVHIGY